MCGGHGLSQKVVADGTHWSRESAEKIWFQEEMMVVWNRVLRLARQTGNPEGRAHGTA